MQRSFYGIASAIAAIVISSILFCVTPGSDPSSSNCHGTDNGYFRVSHPQSGESLKTGTRDSIKWSNKGFSSDSNVSLYLYKGDAFAKTIQTSVSNSGLISWTVPRVASGDFYHIKIANAKDTSQFDLSCSFTIYSDSSGAPFDTLDSTMDAYEPDDVQDLASTLDSLGKPYYHTLPANDIDWVKFLADSATKYTIQIQGYVNGRFSFDHDSSAIWNMINSVLSWTCPKSGEYYFKFTPVSDSLEKYSITVTKTNSLKTVVFIVPTASTVWSVGSSYRIQWFPDSALIGKSANIYLLKNLQQISSIANGAPNSGNFLFDVDRNLGSGSDYRIKIVNASDTGRGGLSSFFTIQGCEADSFEPDNKRNNASSLTPNGKVQNHTLSIGDTDWVSFSIDSGKIYRLLVSGTIATSTKLFYGSDTTVPISNDTWATKENVNSLKWLCPKSGVWYVRVALSSGSTGTGCGAYTFEIAEINSLDPVTVFSPGRGATWLAGSTQRIQWTQDTGLSSNVIIYLFKGQELFLSILNGAPNVGSCTWTIPTSLPTDSTYRVRIVDMYNASLGGYSSPFIITGIAPDVYEPDNKRDSASTLIPLGKAQSHTLTMNDTDWVKFSTDSSGNYLMQCYGDIPMAVFLFYGSDASYTTYFKFSPNSPAVTWKSPKAGVWYARIASPINDEGAPYIFNVAKLDSATLVTISSPAQGDAWTAGSSYQIKWTPDTSILGSNVSLSLYKGTKQLTSIIQGASNSGTYTWYIPSGLATGSDYRIKVANYSYPDLGGFSALFTINGIASDAYEPDNKRDSASTLSPLGTIQFHTLTLNDTDWVKFSLDSGRNYVVQSSGTVNRNIYLYFGNATSASVQIYNGSSSALQWTSPKSGAWFARISPYSNATTGGTYTFNVSAFDSLTGVTFTSPIASSIWSAGTIYDIQWTPDSAVLGSTVVFEIYKGDSSYYYIGNTPNNGKLSWGIPAGLVTGSDYRIKISNSSNPSFCGFSQKFSITGVTPDSYEPDDIVSKASAITTDATVQNRSLSVGDQDWIRFTAQKDSIYLIASQSGENTLSDFYISLYDSSGTLEQAGQEGVNPKIVWVCPKTGSYNLLIKTSSDSYYGKYSISIKTYTAGSAASFTNPTALSIWSAGSAYSIQWVADTMLLGRTVRLQLYNDTNLVRSIVTNALNDGEYSWTPPLGMITGNNYVIKLTSYNTSQLFGFSPAFTISGVIPDAFEPDDSSGISHTIATTGVAESHTLSLNDKDWFKFSATVNYLYVIKTIGAVSSLTLYGTDGKTSITTSSSLADSSTTISMFCATPGTYYFRATSSSAGAYQAMVTANDSTKYDFTFSSPIATDTLTAGQADTIKWASLAPAGGNVDIYLNNGSGVVKTIVANTTDKGLYAWTVPSTATAGNDYFIKIISRVNAHIYGISGVFTIKAN